MWFALALASALFQAGQFAVVKARARHIPPPVIMLWSQVVNCTAWAAIALARGTSLAAPPEAWAWIALCVALAVAMNYLLARGSAGGDLSILGPVLALSPLFMVVPDWLLTGARPYGLGWIGIAGSIAGTIGLSGGRRRLEPRRLFGREDALCALGAAMCLGIVAAIDRRVATTIGVPAYLVALQGTMALVTGAWVAARRRRAFLAALAPRDLGAVLAYAGFAVGTIGLQVTAVTLAPASYVHSVARTSSIWSVLLGRVLFAEPALAGRLGSALLITFGAACLLLAR